MTKMLTLGDLRRARITAAINSVVPKRALKVEIGETHVRYLHPTKGWKTRSLAAPMQVRRGARSFDAVHVPDPVDPVAVSAALPGSTVQIFGGALEISLAGRRVFAAPGEVVLHDRATGVLSTMAVRDFEMRCEGCL